MGIDEAVELVTPQTRVFFDVLGTPPRELALIAPIEGRQRGDWVPFTWRNGKPYRASPPPPEPEDSREHDRWLDDPRSDPIGWG